MVLEGESGYTVFESKSLGEKLYFYSAPVHVNQWAVGIHVAESLVFARMIKVNRMLFTFIGAEVVVLAGYFPWILFSTRRELIEKQRLADTDVLTGLLNRNCYEKNIVGLSAACKESLNVNGRHELNNTRGHGAGDRMLQEVAKTLQKEFGEKDTYRIGGDEFVACAMDAAQEAVEKKLTQINTHLSEQGYHVSIGICREEVPVGMNCLIKQAETLMYEEKRRYYRQTGTDRRHR